MTDKFDCPMLYRGVAVYPVGTFSPCCFTFRADTPITSFKGYRKSEYLQAMKDDFKNGKWPEQCARCKSTEESGAISKRQHEINKFKRKYRHDRFDMNKNLDVIDLRLSNLCNQACVFCNPVNSSLIQKEAEEYGSEHTKHTLDLFEAYKKQNRLDKTRTSFSNEEIYKMIDVIAPNGRLYFTGGEPSILKQVHEILQYVIDAGKSRDVFLEFSSNFHALNPKFLKLLQHFSGRMWISFDAIGPEYEYIRHHGVWETAKQNVLEFKKRFNKWQIEITPAQFMLNAWADFELMDWAIENDIKVTHDNFLHNPTWLDIRLLPMSVRLEILERIQEYKKKIKNVDTDPSLYTNYEKFLVSTYNGPSTLLDTELNLDKLDKIRGKDWRLTFPFLYSIIEKYKSGELDD
jgi:molybdenum cofactor biosynthesis enzyme MoaA